MGTKFSAIPDGSSLVVATDKLLAVRSGTTDLLVTPPATVVPGGSDLAIQYSDDGAFGGFGSWDDVASALTIPGTFTGAPAVRTSGSLAYFTLTSPADTTLAASTEAIGVNFNLSATRQFATGALTTQREMVIQAPTYSFVAASTITTAVTLDVSSPIAGTNATITNSYGCRITASAATHVPLVLSAAASQTADVFDVKDSAGTVICAVQFVSAGISRIQIGSGTNKGFVSSDGNIGMSFGFRSGIGFGLGLSTVFPASLDSSGNASVADDTVIFGNATNRFKSISISTQVFWGTGAANDTGLARVVAGVVNPTNASTGAGWFQNTAGRSRLTADVTENAAALKNLTDLSLTLIAGRKYTGRMVFKGINSTATEGLQFDFNGGAATMTSFWAGAGILSSGGTDVVGTNISTSLAGVINFTTFTGESVIVFEISMVVNAAGTFIPRFAENSHAAGTATARLGSFLWLEDSPN